jgi:hypothetical protein
VSVETAPCFCCGSLRGEPAGRALLVPALTHHVRCTDCGRGFNAKTGASNGPIFLVVGVALAVGAALAALLVHHQLGPL